MSWPHVVIFWLSVWVVYLVARVFILKRALDLSTEWQARAMHAVVKAYSMQVQQTPEDRVLDSEVIE